MPSCTAKKANGFQCSQDATGTSYFWYFDAKHRIDKRYPLCQNHSNALLGSLMASENAMQGIIDRLDAKIKALKPNVTYKTKKDLTEFYRKKTSMYDRKKIIRNRTCRFCDYPLVEPQDPKDQIGDAFSHADFHSGRGYGRAWILFHTECGISWLMHNVVLEPKELKYVRPQLVGQRMLFDT